MHQSISILIALLPAAAVAAAGTPSPADLGALLREAGENSPALRAAAARLEAARRAPAQANTLPDPEVSLSYTNDGLSSFTYGESEFSNLTLTWRQEVPHPGKREQAAEVAEESARVAATEFERARLEVVSEVKSTYADLYRLDQTATFLDETRQALTTMAESARRRYEVGEGVLETVLKAQTEILRLEADKERVSGDRRGAEARLNAMLGRAEDAPIGPVAILPGWTWPADAEDPAQAAMAQSPSVAVLQASAHRAEARAQLARLDLKPDFIWSAAYQSRDGLDPMVMGLFGLRLPLHKGKKQEEALLAAESEFRAAQQDLADIRLRTRAQVQDFTARFHRADRLVTLYSQGVVPQARSTLDSARTAYGVGRLPFLDLMNDQVVVLEARIQLASEEAARMQALAALEPLLGRELIEAPAAAGTQGGSHNDGR
jgi:cobalt-zinc-cadmium efflux system outer membrane protein